MAFDIEGKQPIHLFRPECKSCAYLDATEKTFHPCHYTKRNKKTGQLNDDCPASEVYFVTGFRPERVAQDYVRATVAGDNKKVVMIITTKVAKQSEALQSEFWTQVQYLTALSLNEQGAAEDDGETDPDDEANAEGVAEVAGDDSQIDAGGEVAEELVDPQQDYDPLTDVAEDTSVAAPADDTAVDSNEWNEE